ncbi:unnamed protein product [Orchesella dallaii]|uniref:BTB domain-containing protein n=1 Tax=Orchesella dallaii TaxID=48710 RepID=A0ABP1PRG5_9HEXA
MDRNDEWDDEVHAENEVLVELDLQVQVEPNEPERGGDQDQDLSLSSDIYLLKNQAFLWEYDSKLKLKEEYHTPIIFGCNKSPTKNAFRGNDVEKPEMLKALEKSFNRTFPLSMEQVPAMTLRRGHMKCMSDYTLFIEVNPKDEFYKKIRKAVTDPVLYVELKVDEVQGLIEILLDDEDFSDLKPFKREFCRVVNKKLKRSEDIKGFISVKLGGKENKLTENGGCLGDKLLNENADKDYTLVGGSGKEMNCHQLILKLHGPFFRKMLESGMKESSGIVTLAELNDEAMEAFLKFLYKWDVEEPMKNFSIAMNLLKVGHTYHIKDLEESMIQVFNNRRNASDNFHWNKGCSLEKVVELYTFAHNVGVTCAGVEETCVKILKSRLDELKDTKLLDKIFATNIDVGKKLFLAFGRK